MKKNFFIVGLFMTIYSSVSADTHWSSPSPYQNMTDVWVKLEVPNAEAITVTVNGNTERYYDRVYIWNDDNSSKLRIFHGDIDESFHVDGNSINMNFKTDYSIAQDGVTVSVEEKNTTLTMDSLYVKENAIIDGDLDVKGEITLNGKSLLLESGDSHFSENDTGIEYGDGDVRVPK